MLDVAIVGAGPYGLSLAAYLRRRGVAFRIFGRVMDSWLNHMPKGMFLKSDGFASSIYDPDDKFCLGTFCREQGIEYSDVAPPVRLETFAAYGLAFQKRMVPELEQKLVVRLDRTPGGFILQLENGEIVAVCRVILAVGITHFSYVPGALSHLPSDVLSHSYSHHDLEKFGGRSVVVVGGGASATDLAGLLHEAKAKVQLVARQSCLKFHNKAAAGPRSLWQRMRYPNSGLGPGLRSRFFANGPLWFYSLPQHFRLEMVRTQLGPIGGWFAKDMVIGRVPLLLGYTLQRAQVNNGGVLLQLRATDGTERKVLAEHIIAATGYKVDLERLNFLSAEIRSGIKAVNGAPILSRVFESSVPGLYFVGIAAANSFGPVMRFAFGASFAARHMTRNLTKLVAVGRSFAAVPASIENRKSALKYRGFRGS